MGGQAFGYSVALVWNQLPVQVNAADSLSTFKTKLKTFLFEKAYFHYSIHTDAHS